MLQFGHTPEQVLGVGVEAVRGALEHNSSQIGNAGAAAIGVALQSNTSLQDLVRADNAVDDAMIGQINFDYVDPMLLAAALRTNTITHADLSSNILSNEDAEVILDALAGNTSLEALVLSSIQPDCRGPVRDLIWMTQASSNPPTLIGNPTTTYQGHILEILQQGSAPFVNEEEHQNECQHCGLPWWRAALWPGTVPIERIAEKSHLVFSDVRNTPPILVESTGVCPLRLPPIGSTVWSRLRDVSILVDNFGSSYFVDPEFPLGDNGHLVLSAVLSTMGKSNVTCRLRYTGDLWVLSYVEHVPIVATMRERKGGLTGLPPLGAGWQYLDQTVHPALEFFVAPQFQETLQAALESQGEKHQPRNPIFL